MSNNIAVELVVVILIFLFMIAILALVKSFYKVMEETYLFVVLHLLLE